MCLVDQLFRGGDPSGRALSPRGLQTLPGLISLSPGPCTSVENSILIVDPVGTLIQELQAVNRDSGL